jgi:hypothetical protein
MAGFNDMGIDPLTGKAKIKAPTAAPGAGTGAQTATTLPYIDPKNPDALLPAAQPASVPATASGIEQGNTAVMAKAQTTALNQDNSGIADNTDEMVKKMQADPSFGYNGEAYKTNELSNYDYNQANAVKTFKEQNADLGGHGEINANLMKTILAGNTDRSNLENTLNLQNVDRAKKDWADAIAAGNTQTTQDTDLATKGINNLLNTRAAYEGERSQGSAQVFQSTENEKARAEEARQFNTEEEYKRWATNRGYDEAAIQRAWQSAENQAGRASTEKIASWNVDLETWKTNQATALTKQGWTEESARQMTQITADANQAELNRALQKAISDRTLSLDEANAARQASQFTDELAWKKEATRLGLDDAAASRTWQAGQNAIKAANDAMAQTEQINAEAYQKEMDRALTRSIETSKIAQGDKELELKYKELAQQATLAGNELAWQKEAAQMGIDSTRATELWKTGEDALDRSQALIISNNQLKLESDKLAAQVEQFHDTFGQQSYEFNTQLDQWVTDYNFKVKQWEAADGNAKTQLAQELQMSNNELANRLTLATIDNQAKLKGIDLTATLDNLPNLPPEVAASTLIQAMKGAGLDTVGVAESLKAAQNTPLPIVLGAEDSPNLSFAQNGEIVTPDGSMGLAAGQAVTLQDNFKVDDGMEGGAKRVIPAGKYTVSEVTSNTLNTGGKVQFMVSTEGKYYPTTSRGLGTVPPGEGFTYNKLGGYYTKTS